MSLQIAITLILLFSMIGIMVWFFSIKNGMGKAHRQTISALESAISTTRFQIKNRNQNLNRYDFQRYNLEDALVVQPEIIILERYRNE